MKKKVVARRVIPRRLTAPTASPAREMWDEIHEAVNLGAQGAIAIVDLDSLVRRRMQQTAELTMRGQISLIDAERVNLLGVMTQRRIWAAIRRGQQSRLDNPPAST